MKLASHTIIIDHYPTSDQHLVYHTRTQALVKIDQGLKEVLKGLGSGNDIPADASRNLTRLRSMGIVVRDEQEERAQLKSHMDQLKYSYDQACLVVTILTTYACNFKCVYCFEEASRVHEKMDSSTQELVISWLKRKMERFGYKKLYVNYYGGEPLLNLDAMDCISSRMKTWCESRAIDFVMSMQTNGFLLTPAIVQRYKKFNLQSIRISVDGVKEDHDGNRPLRGGGGTFERIMKNIEDCVDQVKIHISVGHKKDDIAPIKRLLDYFEDKGLLHKMGRFIFSPINPTLGPQGNPGAIRGGECMGNSDDKILERMTQKINDLLDSKGIKNPKSGMATATCSLTRENGGATIDQQGRIYTCNTLLGHPEFAVGDVRQDALNKQGREFRDLDVWKQCPVDCTYLPMCSGGCRIMSFVGGYKNFKVAACKKSYLNKMAPVFIKRDYDRMMVQKENEVKEENERLESTKIL